ncbi:MAG: 50S ribosomal protein L18 [Candidatus Daviesbacteria bacterium GW2011_GWA2_38_24]|uniref:Large ribosomal subunit protein uL18 n=1 Tax=Candidatus Daviesbacteria bacterium GW2011_GWA2_38_24 TaxID=1618422 RepID=A0A0G0JWB9_9BACT|nr:MAG: 50S ribosomal protein L18 [Candidatus Daviesbacteria bacterium GW2011_GWA2_38_24]OGE24517.1 MAG: 50S ribosomal protein L18 [Candidatus Daviesbacteria bacterium RIFCSPHIGHO2_01_FULL_38_8]
MKRKKIAGTLERPRLSVFRSSQHIYAQIVDDQKHQTLAAESDLNVKSGTKKQKAETVGENIAKKALQKKIKSVVFDRGSFRYHGRVAALAEGARKGGLEF